MKLIVGLGNPGEIYKKMRHNVGFLVIDRVLFLGDGRGWGESCSRNGEVELVKNGGLVLAKPMGFMNNSGGAIKKLIDFYKVEVDDLWVIHDDLDIALGEYKIQKGVGPKVHNGVTSVENVLGKKDFWRIRVGIENRGEERVRGEEYVLSNFDNEEERRIGEVIGEVSEEILKIVGGEGGVANSNSR